MKTTKTKTVWLNVYRDRFNPHCIYIPDRVFFFHEDDAKVFSKHIAYVCTVKIEIPIEEDDEPRA